MLANDKELTQLVPKSQNGDTLAYNKLLDKLEIIIKAFIQNKIVNHKDVEDIVQDSLIAIHKSIGTYKEKQKFKSWVFTIVRFKITDHLRVVINQNKNVINADIIDFIPNNESYCIDNNDMLNNALNELNFTEKQIILWQKVDGYSYKKVAYLLNKSETSVKLISHRGLKKLRNHIISNKKDYIFTN